MIDLRRLFLLVLIVFMSATVTTVQAQTDQCTSVTILNESATQIDQDQICNAASSLVAKGHQIFVFVTDKPAGATEDDWYAIRDKVEGDWGIYNKASDSFSKKAVAIEITTDTSKPWGQDLAFGEMLYNTPLDDDAVVSRVEGGLKNQVATGEITAAITTALNAAYDNGYPPPPPTPEPIPTIIVEGDTTNVQVDTAPIMRGIGTVLLVVLILVAGFLFVAYVAVPVGKKISRLLALKNQATMLRQRLATLLTTLSGSRNQPGLLTGETPEETLIYALWAASGGGKYKKRDGEVRENLRRSQAALNKAFLAWKAVDDAPPARTEQELEQLVADLEMLYLTVVGRTQRILGMTQDEQIALLDPMLAMPDGSEDEEDVQLVEQIDQIVRRQQGAGSLRIQLMMVSPDKVDAEGILGYVDQVKGALHELSIARTEGPEALRKSIEIRKSLGESVNIPQVMSGADPFAYPDRLIAAAEKALAEELWLEVKDNAEKAIAAMQRIPFVINAFATQYQAQVGRREQVETILSQGFKLTESIQKALEEVDGDIATVIQSVVSGDYSRAEEYVRELEADGMRALQDLEILVALREKNASELSRLAVEVARVDAHGRQVAKPAWDDLGGYPRSNWQAVETNYETAVKILSDLFDDPSDERDMASNIARANSLEQQSFGQAERMLVDAFSQLGNAERELGEIVSQLTNVQQIEQAIKAALVAVDGDIVKADGRRDADDAKIDEAVDDMISEAERLAGLAKTAAAKREFITANDAVSRARQLASQAYASADSQADEIDRLYKELETVRESASSRVGRAATDYAYLTPAAQKASTGGSVNHSQAMLVQAKRAESSITGEDRELAKTLKLAVETYRRAEEMANEALEEIRDDKAEYEQHVSAVNSAISSAASAISQAGQYVRDGDAGGAGRSALSRAQSMVPAAPEQGESIDALARKRRAAEQAANEAQTAASEARRRIREVEEEREAERRRIAAIETARREREAAEARRRSSYSSSSSSFGSSSSSRSSSFGSSSSRSSSMGSSRRR
jgi:hypothetical protein